MTGIEAFLDVLAKARVAHLFGNPGTTELPLNDALAVDARFRYILGLHEIPVVAMADGLAMASGGLGVANVHIGCGLGNAMGMLYNAHVEGTPLLLTAGQQDRRLRLSEPVLDADLVSVARPWTKWAYEVQRVEDVPQATRRAIQVARTPPTGPVFLSLPVDLQSEARDSFDTSPPSIPDPRVRPPLAALRRAAELLAGARNPALLAGSRVTASDGCAELAAVAERLGAPVFAENTTTHGRLPIAADHPHYRGILSNWIPEIRAKLEPFDVLLVVGMPLARVYLHAEPDRPIPEGARIVHLDDVPWDIGKNGPVEVGLIGDPKAGLAELRSLLPEKPEFAVRRERLVADRFADRDALRDQMRQQLDARPMTALGLMSSVSRVLPERAAVVEEAVTTHHNALERLGNHRDPSSHIAQRGWALGWGIGCALGVKLAWPDRPVLGLIGDGAALYGIQGLWTAARYRIPVVFLICNNAQYRILKMCSAHMPLPRMQAQNFVGMDLVGPEVDFVGLAKAFGVAAFRATTPDEVADRLRDGFGGDGPVLIDAVIAR